MQRYQVILSHSGVVGTSCLVWAWPATCLSCPLVHNYIWKMSRRGYSKNGVFIMKLRINEIKKQKPKGKFGIDWPSQGTLPMCKIGISLLNEAWIRIEHVTGSSARSGPLEAVGLLETVQWSRTRMALGVSRIWVLHQLELCELGQVITSLILFSLICTNWYQTSALQVYYEEWLWSPGWRYKAPCLAQSRRAIVLSVLSVSL